MEKLDKKKILAVVLIIALIASLVSTVSLLYNSIDMFLHSAVSMGKGFNEVYNRYQLPYAIITLFAFLAAALGTGAGIASFVVKKSSTKKLCLILALCSVGVLLILTVATAGVNFANEAYYSNEWDEGTIQYPWGDYSPSRYALYSAVMSVMLQQLVLCAIIAGALLIVSIMDKKAEKAATESVEEQQ